jgi:hypothetical protein
MRCLGEIRAQSGAFLWLSSIALIDDHQQAYAAIRSAPFGIVSIECSA